MAAVLKKRALAEFSAYNVIKVEGSHKVKEEDTTDACKNEQIRNNKIRARAKCAADAADQLFTAKNNLEQQLAVLLANDMIYGHDQSSELLQVFNRCLSENCKHLPALFERLLNTIKQHEDEFIKAAYVGVLKQLVMQGKYSSYFNISNLVDECIHMLGNVRMKLVQAELISLAEKLVALDEREVDKVIEITKSLLRNSTCFLVKRKCLRLLALLVPVEQQENDTAGSEGESMVIMKLLRDYSNYFDARVRSAALGAIVQLHERGVRLDISLYCEFCEALKDDYEGCRVYAIRLLQVLSKHYADCLICVAEGDEQIRFVDDAFAKVCSMVNDVSVAVRTEAVTTLARFDNVSSDFLEQTLDKKLMSNLKLKKSAHERNRESCEAGEWASGRKWASDAPQGNIVGESVTLMNIGACGAFVHALEDEFSQVRMAALDSLGTLGEQYPPFARLSLDFLVDMLNDEIEEIRLCAITCLGRAAIGGGLALRDDQVEMVLPVLKDSSRKTREALHGMLGLCGVSNAKALRSCVASVMDSMARHGGNNIGEERMSVWRCMRDLGKRHGRFLGELAHELLGVHNFFAVQEPSLDDDAYIGVLILVVNAAGTTDGSSLLPIFQKHRIFVKHYIYLRDFVPELVPRISQLEGESEQTIENGTQNDTFLQSMFLRIASSARESTERNGEFCNENSKRVLQLCIGDLLKYGSIEREMRWAAEFARLYLQCELALGSVLEDANWINALLLPGSASASFRSNVALLLTNTFSLLHAFDGVIPIQTLLVLQMRVKALALQLVAVIHGSNASALALCEAFLDEVSTLRSHALKHKLKLDGLSERMLNAMQGLNKPGSVARALKPLLLGAQTVESLGALEPLFQLDAARGIVKAYAVMDEPKERLETPIKFTAGLVLALRVDARVYNVKDVKNIRVRVAFADKTVHVVQPRSGELKKLDDRVYRLTTHAYVSHAVWSEASIVEVNVVLEVGERVGTWLRVSVGTGGKAGRAEESTVVELCEPVRVLVASCAQKKGIL